MIGIGTRTTTCNDSKEQREYPVASVCRGREQVIEVLFPRLVWTQLIDRWPAILSASRKDKQLPLSGDEQPNGAAFEQESRNELAT